MRLVFSFGLLVSDYHRQLLCLSFQFCYLVSQNSSPLAPPAQGRYNQSEEAKGQKGHSFSFFLAEIDL